MLGNGGTGSYLGAIGQSRPGLVLTVGTALAQQDPSVALDEPDDFPGCHQYSLATNQLKCLALNIRAGRLAGAGCQVNREGSGDQDGLRARLALTPYSWARASSTWRVMR